MFILNEKIYKVVRSYKIRGAYNKMSSLSVSEKKGIVCASAGNHAQGVALSCKLLQIHGKIYMPAPTPNQKIEQVKNVWWGFYKSSINREILLMMPIMLLLMHVISSKKYLFIHLMMKRLLKVKLQLV